MMRKTKLFMDTVVDIQVVVTNHPRNKAAAAIDRAFEMFRRVEQACSRFSKDSEVMQATRQIQTAVKISPFLFEPLRFALEVAEVTDGMLDPTIGKVMEDHGFNQHYLTGETFHSPVSESASYQDIILDDERRTLFINKPLVIDLGAVAKGFAIDLAAHELKDFEGFIVNAGGDLFAGGLDGQGRKWKIGIQHPMHKDQVIQTIELSNEAVCTSGSYERKSPLRADVHHLINSNTKCSSNEWTSCSVISRYAFMADAFSTAAFLLPIDRGEALLSNVNLMGILIDRDLKVYRVGGI